MVYLTSASLRVAGSSSTISTMFHRRRWNVDDIVEEIVTYGRALPPEEHAAEEKATAYSIWCLPNIPEGSKHAFPFHAETDRSRVSCTPTCYHNHKGQVLIDTSEWGGTPIRLSGIALCRSNCTKLLTKEKQVCETRRHFAANLVAIFVAILSRCVFLLLQLSSQALTRSADSALWPVEIFTSSRSSHFNGWIIWLLLTSVIFFRLSASFEACLPVGVLVVLGVIQIQVCHCLCLLGSSCQNGKSSQVFLHGSWLMPVKDIVLASRLYVCCNGMYIQTPLSRPSVWRTVNCPSSMHSGCSEPV